MKFDKKHIGLVFMLLISLANFTYSHTTTTLFSIKKKNSRKSKVASQTERNTFYAERKTTIKKTEKSVRVIRIVYDGTSRNFVLNANIPKGRVNVVAFKQTKTKNAFVRYGIVSKNLVSSSNSFLDK